MGLDRRTFLQQAGLALFTWGATEAGISSLTGNKRLAAYAKYQQALAESTSRKLALLVGINRYPHHDDLSGCITDVELQKELLIDRYGFNPQDILTLCDRSATRKNIETAFIEHLNQQAKPGDVVVFHFSGYGGQIKMPLSSEGEAVLEDNTDAFRLVNSFVPADGLSSDKKNLFANSILQETLLVLAQSLSTTKCTFVLDTSFNTTPRSKHSTLKVRSLEEVAENPSTQELDFLAELRENLASKGLKPSKRLLSLPGVVLSATSDNQVAVEKQWNDLSAGLFTQALTQHLWHLAPSNKVQVALSRTAESVEQVMGRQQRPFLNNSGKSAIAYFMGKVDASEAAGIVSKVASNGNVEVKLMGIPAHIWSNYGVNSCLSLVSDSESTARLQIKSKEGLSAKAQVKSFPSDSDVRSGQFVRESIRMLKKDLSLNLALDPDLSRIEKVDATSALANVSSIDSTVVAREQNADCLLGKVATDDKEKSVDGSATETVSIYGLYTAGGELIGKTTGTAEEAVKVAISRLQPQFDNLLAAKWLALTSNEFSSRLKAKATLQTGDPKQPTAWQRGTLVAQATLAPAKKPAFAALNPNAENVSSIPLLEKGAEITVKLNSLDERLLYILLLGTDSNCNLYALYTPLKTTNIEGEASLQDMTLAAGEELIIPSAGDSWRWIVPDTVGINTLYVLYAVRPFTKTLKTFATQQSFNFDRQQVLNITNPVASMKAILQDLHDASEVDEVSSNEFYALNVDCWAALNLVYEVASV